MVKKFSKIMEMNTGQRAVRINAYVGDVTMKECLADRKPYKGDLTVLKVHQIFENEVSCIIEAIF